MWNSETAVLLNYFRCRSQYNVQVHIDRGTGQLNEYKGAA